MKNPDKPKIPAFWLDSKIQRYPASPPILIGAGLRKSAFGKAD
ncbi:MAG: hypothetical protein HLUCCX10_04155 [Algoriphagus marincola HL-49]|uniref:Uncharacterized protein n=1 Tax=Algoriphagus marincola HL-49 TaxID=1305737 RepID=A0A0P8C828_9BACT|nr:MAG: hypothetical protein HLUCCX10_04155 [Algoriphagus marincola HL-49]